MKFMFMGQHEYQAIAKLLSSSSSGVGSAGGAAVGPLALPYYALSIAGVTKSAAAVFLNPDTSLFFE